MYDFKRSLQGQSYDVTSCYEVSNSSYITEYIYTVYTYEVPAKHFSVKLNANNVGNIFNT